jgi:hypothetical protein
MASNIAMKRTSMKSSSLVSRGVTTREEDMTED